MRFFFGFLFHGCSVGAMYSKRGQGLLKDILQFYQLYCTDTVLQFKSILFSSFGCCRIQGMVMPFI